MTVYTVLFTPSSDTLVSLSQSSHCHPFPALVHPLKHRPEHIHHRHHCQRVQPAILQQIPSDLLCLPPPIPSPCHIGKKGRSIHPILDGQTFVGHEGGDYGKHLLDAIAAVKFRMVEVLPEDLVQVKQSTDQSLQIFCKVGKQSPKPTYDRLLKTRVNHDTAPIAAVPNQVLCQISPAIRASVCQVFPMLLNLSPLIADMNRVLCRNLLIWSNPIEQGQARLCGLKIKEMGTTPYRSKGISKPVPIDVGQPCPDCLSNSTLHLREDEVCGDAFDGFYTLIPQLAEPSMAYSRQLENVVFDSFSDVLFEELATLTLPFQLRNRFIRTEQNFRNCRTAVLEFSSSREGIIRMVNFSEELLIGHSQTKSLADEK